MQDMRQDAGDAASRPRLLTTRDVQALIRVDRSTIYRMAETGRLPAIKVGRQWRFPEDRLYQWLDHHLPPTGAEPLDANADLGRLVEDTLLQAVANLAGESLGVMILITDMGGRPLAEVANPCGLFAAAHRHPGVLEQCVSGWRAMAEEPDLEPRWQPTPLGFLCARTLVRVGDQLTGMLLAGGVAPAQWPPAPGEVSDLTGRLGVPEQAMGAHLDEVYRLRPEEQQRVLRLLPRWGAFLSRLAGNVESSGSRAGGAVSRSSVSAQRSIP